MKLNEDKNDRRVKKYKLFINSVKLEKEFWNDSEEYRTMIYEVCFVLFLISNDNMDPLQKEKHKENQYQ